MLRKQMVIALLIGFFSVHSMDSQYGGDEKAQNAALDEAINSKNLIKNFKKKRVILVFKKIIYLRS